MLDAPPKPLCKNVDVGPPPTIHADGDALALENFREDLAGEWAVSSLYAAAPAVVQ